VAGATIAAIALLVGASYIASIFVISGAQDKQQPSSRASAPATPANSPSIFNFSPKETSDLQEQGKYSKRLCTCGDRALVLRLDDWVPSTGGTQVFFTVVISLLTMFLLIWTMVGAYWTFPLRDNAHHCNTLLFGLCFYFVITGCVACAVMALVAGVTSCCALIFAMSVGAAMSSVLDLIMDFITFGRQRAPAQSADDSSDEENDGGNSQVTSTLIKRNKPTPVAYPFKE
jgi:hypothetical protein